MIDIPHVTNNVPIYELTLAAAADIGRPPSFVRIPIIIVCTTLTFVLLIAGTATTAISYPPQPPQLRYHQDGDHTMTTALDGDYKLLGPLLIMAGGFLLVVDVILCFIVTRAAYRAVQGVSPQAVPEPMSVVGGPFFLAMPPNSLRTMSPLSREFWAAPNAPLLPEDGVMRPIRPATATISKCHQPPFNPDVGDG